VETTMSRSPRYLVSGETPGSAGAESHKPGDP